MDTVGVKELAERASAVVADVERTGDAVIVTRRGRPVAVVSPINQEALEDFVLTHAPEFVRNRKEAEQRFARGQRGRPLADVMADLDAEERGTAASA